jgi:protein-disulfide isomerase
MPSAKQSRRRRRAAQAPPPATRTRQASPRVLIAVAAVLALVVIGVVLALVLSGGSSNPTPSGTSVLPEADEVQQLLAGIPQHGKVLGSPSAPVTLVEYVDLQCPYCQQFETRAMPTLIKRYVRRGKVKVDLRVLAFLGPDSERGRSAAIAAAEQNKSFNFAQLLYDNQGQENTGWLDDAIVRSAASSIPGLDVSRLLQDRSSSAVAARAKEFDAQATAAGVHATPTILVGKSGSAPGPVRLSSPDDEQSVASAIDAALA